MPINKGQLGELTGYSSAGNSASPLGGISCARLSGAAAGVLLRLVTGAFDCPASIAALHPEKGLVPLQEGRPLLPLGTDTVTMGSRDLISLEKFKLIFKYFNKPRD